MPETFYRTTDVIIMQVCGKKNKINAIELSCT